MCYIQVSRRVCYLLLVKEEADALDTIEIRFTVKLLTPVIKQLPNEVEEIWHGKFILLVAPFYL